MPYLKLNDFYYDGEISWTASFNGDQIDSGSLQKLDGFACVDLSVSRQGDGQYSFRVVIDLEPEIIILTSSCAIVCNPRRTNTPTDVPPPPAGGGEGGVLIPVTGFGNLDDGGVLMQRTFQSLGFSFLSLGLVLHGFSLRMKDDEETS